MFLFYDGSLGTANRESNKKPLERYLRLWVDNPAIQ